MEGKTIKIKTERTEKTRGHLFLRLWQVTSIGVLSLVLLTSCATTPDPAMNTLKEERDRLASENAALKAEKARKDAEAKERTEELNRAREQFNNQIAEAKKTQEEIRAENVRLKTQLTEVQEGKAALLQEIDRLAAEENRLRQSLKDEIEKGNVEIRRFENVLVVLLRDSILFAPDRADLNPQFEPILLSIARSLERLPEKVLRIEGHTAIAPTRWPSSWDLGAARAVSVVRFLHERGGIDPLRLVAVSFGQFRPVAPNDTEENRQKNRRVEFAFINRPVYEIQELREAGILR